MENLAILEEVLRRSKEDPWCRECLEQIQKYEDSFHAIRNKLTEAEQEQLDLYIGACKAMTEVVDKQLCHFVWIQGIEFLSQSGIDIRTGAENNIDSAAQCRFFYFLHISADAADGAVANGTAAGLLKPEQLFDRNIYILLHNIIRIVLQMVF